MNNEQDKNEKDKDIIDHIGGINTAVSGAADEWLKKAELPKSSWVLSSPFWTFNAMILGIKIAQAKDEREVFNEVYKFGSSAVGSFIGAFAFGKVGAKLCSLDGLIEAATCGIVYAGFGAFTGSQAGEAYANHTSDKAFDFYQNTQNAMSSFTIDLYVAYESLPTFTSKPYQKRSSEDVFKNLRCLQPTTPHYNFSNKNISKSLKDTISSKVTQTPKEETLNLKN